MLGCRTLYNSSSVDSSDNITLRNVWGTCDLSNIQKQNQGLEQRLLSRSPATSQGTYRLNLQGRL
jgi:hypothetical protein